MMIPKYLQRPGMSEDAKKRLEQFVETKRKEMQAAPTFKKPEAATQAAVKMSQKNPQSFPSVWKEPPDVGKKYAVVHTENREDAQIAGYTEVVDEQKVFDKAKGITRKSYDEIEEV